MIGQGEVVSHLQRVDPGCNEKVFHSEGEAL